MGEGDACGVVEGGDHNSVCQFVPSLLPLTPCFCPVARVYYHFARNNAAQRDVCELKQASAQEPNMTLGKSIIVLYESPISRHKCSIDLFDDVYSSLVSPIAERSEWFSAKLCRLPYLGPISTT